MPTYGKSGSTLVDELNRLANGGGTSYPATSAYKDTAAAARAWASARAVSLSTSDTVGVLNQIAGNTQPNWKDIAGVCNQLASTTGLEPAAALREVLS